MEIVWPSSINLCWNLTRCHFWPACKNHAICYFAVRNVIVHKKHIFSALPICTECRASDARSRKLDYRITNRLNYNYCTYWNWRQFWFQVQVRNYICVVIHFYFQLLIKFKVSNFNKDFMSQTIFICFTMTKLDFLNMIN